MKSEQYEAISRALEKDRTVDISTLGWRSGQWRRIEIWFHYINGRIFLTGIPRPRGWYANVLRNPAIYFHLKESLQIDLAATARPITDSSERQEILGSVKLIWYHQRSNSIDAFIHDAPLVEVIINPG